MMLQQSMLIEIFPWLTSSITKKKNDDISQTKDGKQKIIKEVKIPNVSVAGVDTYSNDITAVDRNGAVTAQKGNITFDVQQADALKSDSGVRIFAYGANQIKSLTGMGVAISNVVITPTQISTTTTAAVSNSVTIPVTEAGNISTDRHSCTLWCLFTHRNIYALRTKHVHVQI